MINSQRGEVDAAVADSISKGMGDQFSAGHMTARHVGQYIKGDG